MSVCLSVSSNRCDRDAEFKVMCGSFNVVQLMDIVAVCLIDIALFPAILRYVLYVMHKLVSLCSVLAFL
jgi:hypothetical protein